MSIIRVGFIGLGGRGAGLLKSIVIPQKDVQVVYVCDAYEDRTQNGAKIVQEAGWPEPEKSTNYMDVVTSDNVDAVVVASDWVTHIEIAIAAMKNGKAVGMEVGGATDVEECWDLVRTWEETRVPFMMMENCCFGKREMMALEMVRRGLFGEVVHCSGGYFHDLRDEISFGKENRHYRLKQYTYRNCENYPTHEIGPIAKLLNINTGNRFVSLTSTSSKAAGLKEYIKRHKPDDEELLGTQFNQGDIVNTVIKCANGETVAITLDTTLPRFYSRGFTVRGTLGMYQEDTDSVFIDDNKEHMENHFEWLSKHIHNAKDYEEEYMHPVWKAYIEEGVQGSHDGMDYLEFQHFFRCLHENKPMPIDVYDAATWMVITALSQQSIDCGSAPVAFPDFTKGKWTLRKRHELF